MIQDMGNVKLFELLEMDPKTQCEECLLYWSQGIVYCLCGHLLKGTLDLLSVQNYVIKTRRPHDNRYGKTQEQRDYHIAHNLRKKCIKKLFNKIHDRFLKDPELREPQLEHDRTEKSVSR